MDCSPPGFSVQGISQARILEWVAISFSILWGASLGFSIPPGLSDDPVSSYIVVALVMFTDLHPLGGGRDSDP